MTNLTENHQKLKALTGTWVGQDTMYPTPFMPNGGTATTTYIGKLEMNGLFVVGDDVQEQDGKVFYLAHKVFGYDENEQTFTFHLFDSFGANPTSLARGSWESNVLKLEQDSPSGLVTYTYTFESEELYRFRMEINGQPFIEGVYKRQ